MGLGDFITSASTADGGKLTEEELVKAAAKMLTPEAGPLAALVAAGKFSDGTADWSWMDEPKMRRVAIHVEDDGSYTEIFEDVAE